MVKWTDPYAEGHAKHYEQARDWQSVNVETARRLRATVEQTIEDRHPYPAPTATT